MSGALRIAIAGLVVGYATAVVTSLSAGDVIQEVARWANAAGVHSARWPAFVAITVAATVFTVVSSVRAWWTDSAARILAVVVALASVPPPFWVIATWRMVRDFGE